VAAPPVEGPIEVGPGRSLLTLVLGLHALAWVAVAWSQLPVAIRLVFCVLVVASAWRLCRAPRRWLWQDAAGWWLGDGVHWDGPWRLAEGGRLWRQLAILELRRDRRREHCIICREGMRRADWLSLRRRLNLR
jgi:hypothetical protein